MVSFKYLIKVWPALVIGPEYKVERRESIGQAAKDYTENYLKNSNKEDNKDDKEAKDPDLFTNVGTFGQDPGFNMKSGKNNMGEEDD